MTEHIYIVQLKKQYSGYLKAIILDISFEPVILRGGKNKPATTVELHQQVSLFQQYEKRPDNKGWSITWEEWTSKKLGKQQWPSSVIIATEEDYLFLIKKEEEVIDFKKPLQQLLQWRPQVKEWLAERPALVLELKESWTGICAVIDYLLNNTVKGFYLRSLPVPVHTKFIERHRVVIYSLLQHLDNTKFPISIPELEDALSLNRKPFLFTLRWLDQDLAIQYTAGMDLLAVPVNYLQQQSWKVKRVILVENATNLYLFKPIPGTLVICSFGKALHLLKEIPFLHTANVYYWGDMDEKGFEMLNEIRTYYTHIVSLFMDEATIAMHQDELNVKQIKYRWKEYPLLQSHETTAWKLLFSNSQWLEQEKLQQSYVQDRLKELFG